MLDAFNLFTKGSSTVVRDEKMHNSRVHGARRDSVPWVWGQLYFLLVKVGQLVVRYEQQLHRSGRLGPVPRLCDNQNIDPQLYHIYYFLRRRIHIRMEGLGVMVFTATFSNISVISWRSDLLVEETGVPGEDHSPVASH